MGHKSRGGGKKIRSEKKRRSKGGNVKILERGRGEGEGVNKAYDVKTHAIRRYAATVFGVIFFK